MMKTPFTTPAELRLLGDFRWELLTDFEYHVGRYPSDRVVRVPAGAITDLASVLRFMWAIFPPHGKYAKAAIVHDYLYLAGEVDRKEADNIFLEGMTVLGVKPWRRRAMYWAVRLFGGRFYASRRKAMAHTRTTPLEA